MDVNSVADQHRGSAPNRITCAVLTVSDTRTMENDRGGAAIEQLLAGAGHAVACRLICPDDPAAIRQHVQRWVGQHEVEVILLTGGTGISARDQTYETLSAMLTKPLPGYGELFRWLSYQEIGAAAMLSRALGGLIDDTVILTMPGSPAAVELAMERLILPELGHLVQQAHRCSVSSSGRPAIAACFVGPRGDIK